MLDIYKELLPTLDGYITDSANINMKKLEIYLNKLSENEKAMFEIIPSYFKDSFNNLNDEFIEKELKTKNLEKDMKVNIVMK